MAKSILTVLPAQMFKIKKLILSTANQINTLINQAMLTIMTITISK